MIGSRAAPRPADREVLTDEVWKAKLDALMQGYDRQHGAAADGVEDERRARERFRQLRATVIEPTMREIGEYLKVHGHEYEIRSGETRDVGGGKNDEPSIALAVYPRGYKRTKRDPEQAPSVLFRAGDVRGRLRTQFVKSLPGGADVSGAGHTYALDEVTPDLVRREAFELLEAVLGRPPVGPG